eukprot:scaffold83989_cov24-Prasinocladus_malaysianus.AAC.1
MRERIGRWQVQRVGSDLVSDLRVGEGHEAAEQPPAHGQQPPGDPLLLDGPAGLVGRLDTHMLDNSQAGFDKGKKTKRKHG